MIHNGLYPYNGNMSKFLASPIKLFKWTRFFLRVNEIRPDMVKLFYKGYINEEQHYPMAKGQKVNFGPDAINMLYGLESNVIGQKPIRERLGRRIEKSSLT